MVYRDRHKCPHPLCKVTIDITWFCCGVHWRQLTRVTQNRIYSTAGKFDQARIEAVKQARHEWDLRRPRRV